MSNINMRLEYPTFATNKRNMSLTPIAITALRHSAFYSPLLQLGLKADVISQ